LCPDPAGGEEYVLVIDATGYVGAAVGPHIDPFHQPREDPRIRSIARPTRSRSAQGRAVLRLSRESLDGLGIWNARRRVVVGAAERPGLGFQVLAHQRANLSQVVDMNNQYRFRPYPR
jgi:hypothetical protein